MLSLLPTELWQYSAVDLVSGIFAAGHPDGSGTGIDVPGLGRGVPIRSARAAIIVAIKALGLRAGTKIGVPLYCCPVVFKAIKAAECRPRFLDIDPETFCISPEDLSAKRSDICAVIAVHMFGNPCDMPAVLEAMNGKPVIEDCAQSLGSRLGDRVCGSFGQISFFSFRSGKYLSVGEGGALFSINKDLLATIYKLVSALPQPTHAEELKHVIITYLRSKLRSRPLWGLLGSRIWHLYNKKVKFADKSPIHLGQIYRSDLALIRKRMGFLDSMIAAQRAYALFYERHLQVSPSILCLQRPGTFYNRFMFPITFPSAGQRDMIMAFLRSHGISTAKPYEEVIRGAAEHYGYEGDCPAAEQALKRAIIIPNYYKVTQGDVEHIAEWINKGVAENYGEVFNHDV